jgi:hypothetical protein
MLECWKDLPHVLTVCEECVDANKRVVAMERVPPYELLLDSFPLGVVRLPVRQRAAVIELVEYKL